MKLFFLIVFILNFTCQFVKGQESLYLDTDGKYLLSWELSSDGKNINFDITVETLGFIGFGISKLGQMDGADLFVAGMKNNISYAYDLHGDGHNVLPDLNLDWHLESGSENATHTMLHFWRLLNTCDSEDLAITNGTTRIIWSYGETDDLEYHGGKNRGTTSINFLLPKQPVWDPSLYNRFDVVTNITMPKEETTYWCTIHRGPKISTKNHIVAFEALLNNEDALTHTHHFILTMCNAPLGENATEIFDQHVNGPGNSCYEIPENQPLPLHLCREYLYVWAVGGKPTQFPEHVGYPFGEMDQHIYYMLEVHYHNPTHIENLNFKTGLSFYHTEELRSIDAGLMWTPHAVNPALIVPPRTSDFVISTHCSPTCTSKFPSNGINIFNVLLHSHIAGRQMRFRHFRNGVELPWILDEQHYDFNFQQNAHLWEEVNVLPGDQMTVECVFDGSDRANVTSGGYSTREEMCEAIFWYYPKIKVSSCGSEYPLEKALEDYGVTNYTMIPVSTEITMPWIWEPESLAGPNGMDFLTSLNTRYNWTPETIEELRYSRRFGVHEFHCSVDDEETTYGNVQYPNFDSPYEPIDPCKI